jgi:hypothetical protein
MKSPLRNAILIPMVLLVGFNQPAKAQTPDAAELLRDVQARYASLETYSATGEVLSGVTPDSSASIFPAGQSQDMRSTFTIKLARPQMYKIVWEQGNNFFSSKGAVWSDGESRYVTMGGQITQPADTETAIAMATGVSAGAAHTIPSIFFDLAGNGITSGSNTATLAGGDLIEGEDCYVVKVHTEHVDRTFWISKTSALIRREMAVTSGQFDMPELTDDDARKVLESMGQKATDEAIRNLRNMMASTNEFSKSIKSSYMIETHREIKTNDIMSPNDFR